MRLPRLRFTIRWMMVVVAVVGLAFEGTILAQRSRGYAVIAQEHSAEAKLFASCVEQADIERAQKSELDAKIRAAEQAGDRGRAGILWYTQTPACGWRELEAEAFYRDRVAYHVAMRAKYERAARYPWLSVAPDPPKPRYESVE